MQAECERLAESKRFLQPGIRIFWINCRSQDSGFSAQPGIRKNVTTNLHNADSIDHMHITGCLCGYGQRGSTTPPNTLMPDGLILICETRQPPTKGGAEEIPVYNRCYCESVM